MMCGCSPPTRTANGPLVPIRGTGSTNLSPVFSDAESTDNGESTTREVPENSPAGTEVGDPVTADDPDADPDDPDAALTYTLEETDDWESFGIVSTSGQITTRMGVTYDYEATKNSYSVTVRATDGNGGTDTIAVGIDVTDVGPPAKPDAPDVKSVTSIDVAKLYVDWDAPGNEGKPPIESYDLRYRKTSDSDWTEVPQVEAPTTNAQIEGLAAGTIYLVQVRATSIEGDSDWSDSGMTGTPLQHGVFATPTTITEGESTTITIIPEGAPFDTDKSITVVMAGQSGHNKPLESGNGVDGDFSLFAENGDRLSGSNGEFNRPGVLTTPFFSGSGSESNGPGISGNQPHYTIVLPAGEGKITMTLDATDDGVSECREELSVYTYTDYGGGNQKRITQYEDKYIAKSVFIEDDDRRAKIKSAVVNGRTVMLTLDQAIGRDSPPDDPNHIDYEENPNSPEQYFSLFTGSKPGKYDIGTMARSFSLLGSGETVMLTFPKAVGENVSAWVRYDQWSRYSPLGEPLEGRCGYAVASGTWLLERDGGGTTVTQTLPELTIADAQVTEDPNANIAFTVTLTPASSELVVVDYSTIAQTATGGAECSGSPPPDYISTEGELTFGAGETSKEVVVTVCDDTVEDSGETFLLDLFDASGATMKDTGSRATGTIFNTEDEPTVPENTLTASFTEVPAEHAGPGERFTFELTFSENPKLSYKTLRDHSFTVTGGEVRKAKRLERPSNIRWLITVEPLGWEDVSVELPGGRACGTEGAVCTEDGMVLSGTISETVPGPLTLSVADARAQEGPNAELAFPVTLSRAAGETVTVGYATSDGTAAAGADYTPTSGTLTFGAGETEKTVNVAVLDDVHDDGGETLMLTLSDPTGARIRDAEALGTIENSDPLPKAWLARFGRTVANHVVEAVRGRMSSAQGPSRRVTLGGADLKKSPAPEITQASPWDELTPEDRRPEGSSSLRMREFLLSSSFEVSLAENENPEPGWTAWGGAARTSFSGQDSDLSIDGDVTTATLGVDRAWDRLITGLALARSTGEGSYSSGDMRGDLKSSITSAHPYLRFSINDRLSAWTLLGYGKGELTLAHGAGEERTDIEMKMAALGARGALVAAGGFDISARSDVLLVRTSSEGTSEMAETEADVSRLRLVLEGSRPLEFASGSSLTPSVELGVRRDGGDAERGVGFEVGGAVRYVNPSIGLTVEITARRLMAHEQSGYSEWGAGGSLEFAPGGADRGFSARLGSSVGTTASGVEGLWAMGDARGLTGGARAPGRLDAEAGYAMGAFGGSGVITPYGGFSMSGDRRYRAGWRLRLGDSFNLSLEGDRTGSPDAPSRHAVALRGSLRW